MDFLKLQESISGGWRISSNAWQGPEKHKTETSLQKPYNQCLLKHLQNSMDRSSQALVILYTYINIILLYIYIYKEITWKSSIPGGIAVKNTPASAGDTGCEGSIPGLGRSPGVGNDNLLQYSCLEKFHGQRSLVGYSPWDHKEPDSTEQLSTHIKM